MNYIYHIKSPISLICIAPHKCQRKLCVECMYDHGVDTKQTVPINKFQDKAMKKLKDSKPEDTSKLNEQRMIFKVLLTQIDQMLKKILEELSQSIKQVYDWIEKENQSYLNLINESTNLAESSYTDIDIEKLVNIVDGPTLYNWNLEKNSYLIDLNKQKSWWDQHIKTFIEKSDKGLQIQQLIKEEEVYQMKQDLFEMLSYIQDIDDSLQNRILVFFQRNKVFNILTFLQKKKMKTYMNLQSTIKRIQRMSSIKQVKQLMC